MAAGFGRAQNAVSPSQTGMFFNDLRARADQVRRGMATPPEGRNGGVTGTEGTYTFDQSQYVGQSMDQRQLGTPMGVEAIARETAIPVDASMLPVSRSQRLAGDYTAYSGPYPSTSTFFAPTYVSDPYLAGRRNIKIGPVNIGFGLSGSLEFNDNVVRSSTEKLSDIIASVYLSVDANYMVSEFNSLTLTASAGINHYFSHPEASSNGEEFDLNVLPGTTLAFNMKVGNFVFVFYDRVSIRPASQDQFALDNQDVFGVFQNDAGVAMNWAINSELNFSMNVNRSDSVALEEVNQIYDRNITSLSASLAWTPTGAWTVGVEGSVSLIDYKEQYNNDGRTSTAGIFLVLPISQHTTIRAAFGLQNMEFDAPPSFTRTVSSTDITTTQASITAVDEQIAELNAVTVTPEEQEAHDAQLAALTEQQAALTEQLAQQTTTLASEDATFNSRTFDNSTSLNDYYYNFTISNQLNPRIAQQLSFGHESTLNTNSNFVTSDYVTYGVGVIIWRGARLSLSGFYENAEESGGRLKEDIRQYGFDIQLTHRLSEDLTAGIGYHFGNTDSDLELRDYKQHAYSLDLSYRLSRKWTVNLGYRFWQTNADDPTQNFEQNRIILSSSYNFGD